MGLLAEKPLVLESGGVDSGLAGGFVKHHPDKKPLTPNLLDLGGVDRPDTLHEVGSKLCRPIRQLLIHQHIQRCGSHRTCQRVPPKGGAMASGLENAENVLVGGDGGDGKHPAPQGLTHDNDIRGNPLMLESEGLTGAAEAGLHLIHGEKHVVLLGDALQPLEETLAGNSHSRLPLNGLHENTHGVFGYRLLHRLEIIVGNHLESRGVGTIMILGHLVHGEGDNGDGTAMEVLFEDDDLRLVLFHSLDHVAPLAHGLNGGLHRLSPGVHGKDHLFAGEIRKLFGEEGPAVVEEGSGGESNHICLILESLDNPGMPVPLVDCGVSGEHIHIAPPLGIFHPNTLSLGDNYFQGVVVMRSVLMLQIHQFLG